jgi:3-oxoacyl-[acyl-carrier-protein] synthase II
VDVNPRRVVITGLGVLTGPVEGASALWQALMASPPDRATFTAVEGFEPRRWVSRQAAQRTDVFAQLGVAASVLALEDAGGSALDPSRTGVVMGVALGPYAAIVQEHARYLEGGDKAVSALMPVRTLTNGAAAAVGSHHGLDGPCFALATGCASGAHAVGEGARLVRSGECDIALAGASEGGMSAQTVVAKAMLDAGLDHLRVLADGPIGRPFDRERSGFVPADGAAVLVLEDLERARARGAQPYAEVLACSNVLDDDLVAPAPDGRAIRLAVERALAKAGVSPEQVVHVDAHGSGTPANDVAEANALHDVFGERPPPVVSVKGLTGHSGAAAGAVEAVAVSLSLRHGLLPPTHGLRDLDPELRLDVVRGEAREWQPGISLSTNLGLGGHVGCLVLGPPPD